LTPGSERHDDRSGRRKEDGDRARNNARFVGDVVILSPPFAVAPQRVVVVEQRFARFTTVLVPSPGFAVRPVVPFTTAPERNRRSSGRTLPGNRNACAQRQRRP
jgi:hypothetical protein